VNIALILTLRVARSFYNSGRLLSFAEMALSLRYFTEFGSFPGALPRSGWQSHNYGQFTITMSSSKRL